MITPEIEQRLTEIAEAGTKKLHDYITQSFNVASAEPSPKQTVSIIETILSESLDEIAQLAAREAFKEFGRDYVRNVALETIDKLFKIE